MANMGVEFDLAAASAAAVRAVAGALAATFSPRVFMAAHARVSSDSRRIVCCRGL